MAGTPSDARFITGGVPPEMREGADLTPGVEVAAPTARVGADGVEEHITQVRIPRPAHIPAGPPKVDPDDAPVPMPRRERSIYLRYEFPLFPDIQCIVEFQGNATADHLEQLTSLLNVQCEKLREQERRRQERVDRMLSDAPARKTSPRKVRIKKEIADGNDATP